MPEHPDYPEHTHEFTELVVVYEGCGVNCMGGFEYPMGAGDVFIIHEKVEKVSVHASMHRKKVSVHASMHNHAFEPSTPLPLNLLSAPFS